MTEHDDPQPRAGGKPKPAARSGRPQSGASAAMTAEDIEGRYQEHLRRVAGEAKCNGR